MHKLKIVKIAIVIGLALLAFAVPVFAKVTRPPIQIVSAPICKNPTGITRERINPAETKRNAQGCVVPSYPAQCTTKNCYNCEDFQYQEDAQNFFSTFPNDPSGLDGRPGNATAGKPNVACENRPKRPN